MARRHVERIEEMPRVLDLVTVDDVVAESEEDILDLAPDLRDEVVVATGRRLAGECDVDDVLRERTVEFGTAELVLPPLDEPFEVLAQRVEDAAALGVANLPECLLELALPAQIADAGRIELFEA